MIRCAILCMPFIEAVFMRHQDLVYCCCVRVVPLSSKLIVDARRLSLTCLGVVCCKCVYELIRSISRVLGKV